MTSTALDNRIVMDPPARVVSAWISFRTYERTATVMRHRGRREYRIPGLAERIVVTDNRS